MGVAATIRVWGEMVKFSHSVFALPFALIATFLAGRQIEGGLPTWTQVGLIAVCMVAARSFAMTFNRIADIEIDARNPRTAGRPIQTGRISRTTACVFTIAAGLVFVAGCGGFAVFCENLWPLRLSLPSLALLAAYSYAKRFTTLAHFILGAAIAFAPLAAWIAIDPASLGLPAVLLAGVVLLWIAGFDIIYACQDVESDRRDGLFSLPARLGIARALMISRLCHLLTVALLVWLGSEAGLGWLYGCGVGLTALLLAAEQAVVKPDDLSRVNLAFFTLNGCVSLLLGAATVCEIVLSR
jgi:4-hydroxybenzoate polyprenyltransferase